jgi:hypothetical protein
MFAGQKLPEITNFTQVFQRIYSQEHFQSPNTEIPKKFPSKICSLDSNFFTFLLNLI